MNDIYRYRYKGKKKDTLTTINKEYTRECEEVLFLVLFLNPLQQSIKKRKYIGRLNIYKKKRKRKTIGRQQRKRKKMK